MPDREKVIKGLECCKKDDCDNCPYYDPEVDHDCDYFGKCLRGNMYHDALALLKAQEPRVMTLEASDADWRDGVLWLEQRDYKPIRPCLFRNCREQLLFGRLERVMCFDVVGRLDSVYMLRNYGVKYRCWTSRPTDEQRETTPWE